MIQLHHGDCLQVLPTLPDASVDAVVTDPPYPEADRDYGRMTECNWIDMMHSVVSQCMRVLKPTGSAVFVLQPNSERVGRMRTWLWEFMTWVGKQYGIVQDVWWWNYNAPPTVHCHRTHGLTRPSVKACVWVGGAKCYRNQSAVLWEESNANKAMRVAQRSRATPTYTTTGGFRTNKLQASSLAEERGGVTPFNIIPIANSNSQSSAGSHGHSAGTPLALCRWWTRYICPPSGVVLDPFVGSGTTGVACQEEGMHFIGIEQNEAYCKIARKRLGIPEPDEDIF